MRLVRGEGWGRERIGMSGRVGVVLAGVMSSRPLRNPRRPTFTFRTVRDAQKGHYITCVFCSGRARLLASFEHDLEAIRLRVTIIIRPAWFSLSQCNLSSCCRYNLFVLAAVLRCQFSLTLSWTVVDGDLTF